jgi:hypothetical protein
LGSRQDQFQNAKRNADIAAAKAIKANIADELAKYGLK